MNREKTMLALEEFGRLLEEGRRVVTLCGFDLTAKLFGEGEQVYLSTSVRIPQEVTSAIRDLVREGATVEGAQLDAFLRLDEKEGIIYLDYLGPMTAESGVEYIHLLQEFIWIANEWRYRLDLKDRQDRMTTSIPLPF
jgi:hypothetical protein